MEKENARFEHQELEWAHRYDESRALLWQMRTGKTRTAVEHACALHDSLSINGVVVIAPNGIHRQWAEEQIHLWGRGKQSGFAWRYSDPENEKKWELWRVSVNTPIPHWLCINMEVLIREEIQDAIKWFKKTVGPAMLIVDECFVTGTLVQTSSKTMPIEKCHPTNIIEAWDESRERIDTTRIKVKSSRIAPSKLYVLTAANRNIVGTAHHPFLTMRGWVEMKDLKIGDFLYETTNWTAVHSMWNTNSTIQQKIKQNPTLSKLLQKSSDDKAKYVRSIKTNADEQPNEKSTNSTTGEQHIKENETQTTYSWRQWTWFAKTSHIIDKFTRSIIRLRDRISNSYGQKTKQQKWISYLLQSRFGNKINQISNRSRRSYPSIISSATKGPKENPFIKPVRLDSVEVLEQGRDKKFKEMCPDGLVHNLETGTGTFIANGFVVHNSHHFARPGAKRTSVIRWLGRMFEYRRILTGTNAENSPFQTFSQFEILERGALGHTTFGGTSKKSRASRYPCPTCGTHCRGFKHEFATWRMERRGGHMTMVLDEYQHLDILKQRMAPYSSVVLRADCEDLPPLMMDHRTVEMEPEQKKWWDTVKNKELEDMEQIGQERVFEGGAALIKLQQIEGGFWLNKDKSVKEIIPIKRNPKMLILIDEIEWHDGQIVTWFEYLHEIDAAQKFLGGHGIECGVFSGREKNRDRHLAAFKAGEVRVLLAQPRAGGEGRDMSAADKIIWFSHTPDAIIRSQVNERATKMGAKSVQIVDIVAPVGKYFLSITDRKSTLADDIARRGLKEVLSDLERR